MTKIPVSITTTDDHLLPAITALFHHRTTWSNDGAEVHAEAARIAEQVDVALDVWRDHTVVAVRAHLAALTAQHPAELVIPYQPAPASRSVADLRCDDCGSTWPSRGALDRHREDGHNPASHSDADIALRQDPRTRCPSCGGQTGTYDGNGQWWPCTQCRGTGYRTPDRSCCGGQGCPRCQWDAILF